VGARVKAIQVRVSEEFHRRVVAYAEKQRRSISMVVRLALEAAMRKKVVK